MNLVELFDKNKNDFKDKISDLVIEYRKKHNMSQREFSEFAGITRVFIAQLETDYDFEKQMQRRTVKIFARIFGIELALEYDLKNIDLRHRLAKSVNLHRKNKGLTLDEQSKILGITKVSIVNLDKEPEKRVRKDTVEKIAKLVENEDYLREYPI